MIRIMNSDETKYVKIVNRNNQININPIICRFSTVERLLTSQEMYMCLTKGAMVSEVTPAGLKPLDLNTYNKIVTEEPKKEETVEIPVIEEPVAEVVTEEPKKEETVEEPVVDEDQNDPYEAADYGSEFSLD